MKETDISVLAKEDILSMIGKDWMLITAGGKDSFNTMTASWGSIGILWNRYVATIYVRPSRYTHDFIERSNLVTLSFFGNESRKALMVCGSASGRNENKVRRAGLTPLELESGAMTFSQARLVLECRKIYQAEILEDNFIDRSIYLQWYNEESGLPHTVYTLQVEKVFVK